MPDRDSKDIVFHVGLGKTASTYLQHRFFPKLQGITYIPTNRYRNYDKLISQGKEDRYLVSREFDQQFSDEVNKFAELYPQAKIIIVLRRNDSWIASQYRRFVKNGLACSFTEFYDIENDQGHWKIHDAKFLPKLELLQKRFTHKPLVLFHDDLKNNPYAFFDRIAAYADATYDKNKISLKDKHKSYSTKQLLLVKKISPYLFDQQIKNYPNRIKNWIYFRSKWLLCHFILWSAPLVPNRWVAGEQLIREPELEKVRIALSEDWQACKTWAEKYGA